MLKDYAVLVLKLSAFIGVAINLTHSKQNKAAKFALGVLLISAIMLPFIDIISTNKLGNVVFPEIEDVDIEVGDNVIESAFEDGIVRYICSQCSISSEHVTVSVDGFDFSSMTAAKIRIALSGKGIYIDYRSLENEIADEFTRGGSCEVDLVI